MLAVTKTQAFRAVSILCITIGLCSTISGHADTHFYKWVDKKGTTHYTQTPPPKAARHIKKVATYNDTPSVRSTAPAPTPQPTATANGSPVAVNVQPTVVVNTATVSATPTNHNPSLVHDSSSNNPLQAIPSAQTSNRMPSNNQQIPLPPSQVDPTSGQALPIRNK